MKDVTHQPAADGVRQETKNEHIHKMNNSQRTRSTWRMKNNNFYLRVSWDLAPKKIRENFDFVSVYVLNKRNV